MGLIIAGSGGSLAGALPLLTYKTGDFITAPVANAAATGTVAGHLYLLPILVARPTTIDQLGCYVTTLAAASTVRLGLWNDDGAGRPSTLVVDAGTIDSSGTGAKTAAVSQVLPRGVYWGGCQPEGGTPQLYGSANQPPFFPKPGLTNATQGGFDVTHSGAFASLSGSTFNISAGVPILFMRVA